MTNPTRLLPLALAFAVACGGGTTEDKSTDTETDDTTDTSTDGLPALDRAPSGSLEGFTPAAKFEDVVWLPAQTVIANPPTVTINGFVKDFESEDPATSRDVSLWFNDIAGGATDANGQVDMNANIDLDGPSCSPVSYLVKELPGLDVAKATYKAHQIYGIGDGTSTPGEFQSVSIDTYRLIPTIVGISIDPAKGAIAGTMYDVTRDPDTSSDIDTGKMEGVRVRINKCPSDTSAPAECTGAVAGAEIKYFIDNFPDRDQPYTSLDGLWGIFNVPEGTFRVEAYGLIDGEEKVIGGTVVRTYADSINIGNIWAGYANGVKYPNACLADEIVDTDETDADTDATDVDTDPA